MQKTFLYRWFGLGRLPRRLSPLAQTEGLLLTAKARQFLSILLESGAKPLASDDHGR